jgi:hypothetical protein
MAKKTVVSVAQTIPKRKALDEEFNDISAWIVPSNFNQKDALKD